MVRTRSEHCATTEARQELCCHPVRPPRGPHLPQATGQHGGWLTGTLAALEAGPEGETGTSATEEAAHSDLGGAVALAAALLVAVT